MVKRRNVLTIQGFFSRFFHMKDLIRVYIWPNAMLKNLLKITPYQDVRYKIWIRLGNKIGEDSYINNGLTLIDSPDLKPNIILGDRVALAPNVTFITSSAPNNSVLKDKKCTKRYIKSASISIGDDSWIGASVIIQPGITIGKECIIGSCTNVTHDIPDGCIAYGNPVKIIGRIINDL